VLLAGGVDSGGVALTSCEIFDPSTGLMTATGSLGTPRLGHVAIPLSDGRVIAAGGVTDFVDAQNRFQDILETAQRTTEIWSPTTGLWTAYRDMNIRRSGHVSTRLPDGRFLLTGGFRQSGVATAGFVVPIYNRGAEIFDPTTGLFVVTTQMQLSRGFHAATVLSDGRVMVVGGMQSQIGPFSDVHQSIPSAEVFDGSTWTQLPILFGLVFPAFHQVLPTPDGRARLVGGLGGLATSLTALAFGGTYHDGGYNATGSPLGVSPGVPTSRPSPRGLHTLTRLYDGSYLVAGGTAAGQPLASAYLYVE
jgi:hypothetical protein